MSVSRHSASDVADVSVSFPEVGELWTGAGNVEGPAAWVEEWRLGPKSWSSKTAGSSGHTPERRKAEAIEGAVMYFARISMYSWTTVSRVTVFLSAARLAVCFDHAVWRGPKTPTSKGCNLWVVLGGRQ